MQIDLWGGLNGLFGSHFSPVERSSSRGYDLPSPWHHLLIPNDNVSSRENNISRGRNHSVVDWMDLAGLCMPKPRSNKNAPQSTNAVVNEWRSFRDIEPIEIPRFHNIHTDFNVSTMGAMYIRPQNFKTDEIGRTIETVDNYIDKKDSFDAEKFEKSDLSRLCQVRNKLSFVCFDRTKNTTKYNYRIIMALCIDDMYKENFRTLFFSKCSENKRFCIPFTPNTTLEQHIRDVQTMVKEYHPKTSRS